MLSLDTFSGVLTAPRRYATVYLDATRSKELGPQEVDERWRALRAELAEQGADEPTLTALDAAVGGHEDVPGPHGQLLVAADGTVLHDLALPEVPRREGARWAPLPDLMPAVAQLGARVPYVLALVDRVGADVTVVGPDHSSAEEQTVKGTTYPVRKVGVGGWSHLRYQHKAEDIWEANARQVAEVIESAVHTRGARAVVLAGDVRARETLRKNLDERSAEVVTELQTGGRADGIDEEKLDAEVDSVVARVALDAALLRAAAGTDATIVTLAPGQLDIPQGTAATLRYPTAR